MRRMKTEKAHVRSHVLPYLDAPVAAAGRENVRVELVVVHPVHRQVMGIVGHQISAKRKIGSPLIGL